MTVLTGHESMVMAALAQVFIVLNGPRAGASGCDVLTA
jgi:hypothetical protein